MQLRNEAASAPVRERCYICFRPIAACFCDVIPSIHNRTHILILQHVKERFHAFNTARIVKHALQNSTLIVDQTSKLAAAQLPFLPNTGVLYPGPDSRLLSDVPESERPGQLVILDGTWHHAKTFMRQIPAIRQLPQFRLDPQSPSTYRIRKEPTETALSTLEATVQSLQVLEPETAGLNLLLHAFDRMIDSQLDHPKQAGRLRRPKRLWNPPANVPSVLMDDLENVVVVYGESSHGPNGIRDKHKRPIYWVAQRLGTGERFECSIESTVPHSLEFLSLLGLTERDFVGALSAEMFCEAWRRFIRPADTMAVFNESTIRMLNSIGAVSSPSVTLKCVNVKRDCRTLDEVVTALQLDPPAVAHQGRAGRRLANVIAFAEYLHQLGRTKTPVSMAGTGCDLYADTHD